MGTWSSSPTPRPSSTRPGTTSPRDPVLATVVATVAPRAVAEDRGRGAAQDPRRWWRRGPRRRSTSPGWACGPRRSRRTRVLRAADAGRRPPVRWPARCTTGARRSAAVNGALPAAAGRSPTSRLAWPGGRPTVGSTPGSSSWRSWSTRPRCRARCGAATRDDVDLCRAWFRAFDVDADEQAGRTPGRSDDRDTSATTTCCGGSTPGGSGSGRTGGERRAPDRRQPARPSGSPGSGPVYTPREHRGRGYASAGGGGGLADRAGARARGPASSPTRPTPRRTRSTQPLGYRPVVDMVNVVLR